MILSPLFTDQIVKINTQFCAQWWEINIFGLLFEFQIQQKSLMIGADIDLVNLLDGNLFYWFL